MRSSSEGHVPAANPEQAHWMRELAKSNAAQPHVPQPRKGTRAEQARRAIRNEREDR
jgi:hypothetical protein